MLHIHPLSRNVQRPTHPNLHVRDMHDAHVVLEAVRLHKLQPVTRRLNEVERMSLIKSGSVFVWEESDDDTGLRRWTDGLNWSASRMREPFLFYETRSVIPRYPPTNPPGLIKQTYSALVTLPPPLSDPQAPPTVRKWHLTAYLEQGNLSELLTVDSDPILSQIVLPRGMYRSGKSRQRQNNADRSPGEIRFVSHDGGSSSRRRAMTNSPEMTPPASDPSHSPNMHSQSLTWQPVSPQSRPSSSSSTPAPQYAPQYTYAPPSLSNSRPSVPMAYLAAPKPGGLLPSFDAAFAHTDVLRSSSPRPSSRIRPTSSRRPSSDNTRSPEDERVISLLNARSALG